MKKYIYVTICVLIVSLLPSLEVSAQYGLDQTASFSGLSKYGGDVSAVIGNLIGSALAIIGVIFFLLMVYGGFLWMTDRGKGDYADKAKNAITAAVIGLVIVLGSYAITNFVFNSVASTIDCTQIQDKNICISTFPEGSDQSCTWGETNGVGRCSKP